MPRKPSLNPPLAVKIYLSPDNAAQLGLMVHNPESGRAMFGEVSRIANEAFSLYFKTLKEKPQWQVQTLNPDSPSLEQFPNPGN